MLMVAQATKTSVTTANHVGQLPSAVWRSQATQIPAGQKRVELRSTGQPRAAVPTWFAVNGGFPSIFFHFRLQQV